MPDKKYTIDEKQKKRFTAAFLLERICNKGYKIPIMLDQENEFLEPVLEFMMMNDYLNIKDNKEYLPTKKGKDVLLGFLARYQEYLKNFDIFCAVDLEQGTFAFEK